MPGLRRLTLRRVVDGAGGAAVALGLLARALAAPTAPRTTLLDRLGAFSGPLPVQRQVTIHWTDQQIPFIEAESDDDLAVALGAVHAHLRLGQMELMRHLAFGRVSELVGPLGLELDRALRLFDFGRAVPAIIDGLAPDTRRWAEGFLRGVNHQIAHGPLPPEFRLLGLTRAAWTLADLLTVARLAAADVNWLVWSKLLRARRAATPAAWRALWPLVLQGGAASALGSNAAVVAGHRSRSRAAMLAADPHLSVSLPNVWLIVGFRSPGLHAVGLMPAGLPVVAIGRNPWIAWGGTSLHAASSDLFDVTGLGLREREEVVRVRRGRPRRMVLRESPLGPVVSDGMLLRDPAPLALRWIGHQPSDEMGAMLGVLRARTAAEFRAALGPFAVPAQNMVRAGPGGEIGHLLAGRLPCRPLAPPGDFVLHPDEAAAWNATCGTAELPHWENPQAGVIASANDEPPPGKIPVGFLFSADDRVTRMRTLLGGDAPLDRAVMESLMLDVAVPASLRLRDFLLPRLTPADARLPAARALAGWNGCYDGASQGALVHEVLATELVGRLTPRPRLALLSAAWTSRRLVMDEIVAASPARLAPALHAAIWRADAALARWRCWDGMHRLRLRHHLGAIPLAGRRFSYGDLPAEGGNDTLNKTGHAPSRTRHTVSYGASARFVADLADPDANRVVLLGGQDGWLGSDNFLDQVALWQSGEMISVPLRPETARAWPHHTMHPPLPA